MPDALVGYTNAGKSTLFNALTGSDTYVADKLFATLDPTVRQLKLAGVGEVVLADTVGFVRELPHELVAAFRSACMSAQRRTCSPAVVDASDPLRPGAGRTGARRAPASTPGDSPELLVFAGSTCSRRPRACLGRRWRSSASWISAARWVSMSCAPRDLAGAPTAVLQRMPVQLSAGAIRSLLIGTNAECARNAVPDDPSGGDVELAAPGNPPAARRSRS